MPETGGKSPRSVTNQAGTTASDQDPFVPNVSYKPFISNDFHGGER